MDRREWRRITPDEQEVIEAVVRKAASVLRAAGFDAHAPRFPFAMHHERLRSKLRIGAAKPKHSDVAGLLNLWASERDFAAAYAWQAVMGAVEALEAKAGRRVPDALRDEAAGACDGTFERWARSRLEAAAD